MKITIRAGGIIRDGPERDLIDLYLERANLLARQTGFKTVQESEINLRSCKTRQDQTQKIIGFIPPNSSLIILDERGTSHTSRSIARYFQARQDDNLSELIIAIGGANGFDPQLLPKQATLWSFGVQTWPHKLIRIMLTEQIYRALSILSGSPYHRD